MSGDLIVGRGEIMTVLKLSSWQAVMKMIRAGCPIRKIEGRWVACKMLLLKWIAPENGQSWSNLTKIDRSGRIDTSGRGDNFLLWRRKKMPEFIDCYRKTLNIKKSCRLTGVTYQTFYNWRRKNEAFAQACSEIEDGIDVVNSEE